MRLPALFLLTLLARPASADDSVSLSVTPPAGEVRLAAEFKLKVDASLPEGFSIRPDTAAAGGEDFEVLSFTRTADEKAAGRRKETFEVRARAFTIGSSTFPAIAWRLSGQGVPPDTLVMTSTFTLAVSPAFATKEGEDIRDIYEPYGYFPWPWAIAGLAAVLLAAWLLSRRRGKAAAAAASWKDTRDPYQRARDRLGGLEKSKLLDDGRLKEYYIGLTSILRLYLREEFSIDAVQMTTGDLSRELKRTGAPLATALKARELLQRSDLVKFARMKPENAADDSEALIGLLMDFHRTAENARTLAAEKAAQAAGKAARAGGAGGRSV
ncbi:MAG: hypothetical protein M0011_08800 [Elusimicrobia bacterium]|nr:hypothetical protein [Elusimicrobiota bacterium]